MTSLLCRETTWRIHEDARSAVLIDGRAYYRAFYAAALTARRSILLLGWQFDTDVELLRGEDLPAAADRRDVQLVSLLKRLGDERPGLVTRILAWDHSMVFAFERQVLQKLTFDASTGERVLFRWDATVPLGGSHHQKVAIIDGRVAFLGSQDICQARWDDSTHRLENAHRTSRGDADQPYHEVQLAVTGDLARSLVDLFVSRWHGATGEQLGRDELIEASAADLLPIPHDAEDAPSLRSILPLPAARLGLARTVPPATGRDTVHEVGALIVRAIERAERLVYIESQYLTSCALRDALIARMEDPSRPKLEVVVVIPHKPEKLKEAFTLGAPQALLLRAVGEAAKAHGHAIGVYNVLAGTGPGGEPVYVYVHSKLMIVDDDVLIVGSANLTNRSLTIDSEIVAAYEAGPETPELQTAIHGLRVRLLREHVGAEVDASMLESSVGLVPRLDALARSQTGRLRKHDLRDDEPGVFAMAMHELTGEVIDPWDGGETCPVA